MLPAVANFFINQQAPRFSTVLSILAFLYVRQISCVPPFLLLHC